MDVAKKSRKVATSAGGLLKVAGRAHMEREQTRGPGWELDYEWLQALATPAPAV